MHGQGVVLRDETSNANWAVYVSVHCNDSMLHVK